MMKENGTGCDHGGHSGDSTEEKVKWNFPGPNRRLHYRLTVVTRFSRNRTTGNVDPFAGNNAILPRLLAQLFESFFGCHEKNANANSVAMIDAIAVPKAEIHADFR